MSRLTTELPGQRTLLSSWRALALLSPGAGLLETPAYAAAVFPTWPVLNNAVLLDPTWDLAAGPPRGIVDGYAGAGTWALWLPGSATDLGEPVQLSGVAGMTRDTSTLVMHRDLAPGRRHPGVVRTSVVTAAAATDEPVPVADLDAPDDVPGLSGWVLVDDGQAVAGAWTHLFEQDCGVYAVGTVPDRRRRGLARALMEHVLADAWERGARSATLQSTEMAQPLYAGLGFVAVGRYEEWVPQAGVGPGAGV